MSESGFRPIEDYFIIGDLRTAALISSRGSIDWLCLPYFDSPSIFGKMLDTSAGSFSIDMPAHQIQGQYGKDTAIVEFKLSNNQSQALVKDFMVPKVTKREVSQQLVRLISGVRGKTTVKFEFRPRPEYASVSPDARLAGSKLSFPVGGGSVILHLPAGAKLDACKGYYQISVSVAPQDSRQLILEYVPKQKKFVAPSSHLVKRTSEFWERWVAQGDYFDFCRDYLVRSAITLKLMQFYPTGAIVAAPTTSLPEAAGGVRNWDYRYAWIRDATFALYSFYVLGYGKEAQHFFNFIEKVTQKCAEDKFDVSLMYTVWGDPVPKEKILENLSGYKSSAPVRAGNAAAKQFQLDVYGALIDAFYFASKQGLTNVNKAKWRRLVMQLVSKIDELWQKPDHGIWEARVGTRHYTYSKVMAWVGADRAGRLKEALNLKSEDFDTCANLERTIKNWIWDNCSKGNILIQHPETQALDATNLLFVLLQFLDKHDPVTAKIIDATAKELSHREVFVYRYREDDGLPGKEGAFVLCSFWLISALAILEEVKPALRLFKRFEKHMKPHALMSEEIDPDSGVYLGNYPQSFSHMGYIMSAHYLNKYSKRKGLDL